MGLGSDTAIPAEISKLATAFNPDLFNDINRTIYVIDGSVPASTRSNGTAEVGRQWIIDTEVTGVNGIGFTLETLFANWIAMNKERYTVYCGGIKV